MAVSNVDVVQKLWGFCHTLRHDGIDYGDYIEQITYLLFLKMAGERDVEGPKECGWPTVRDISGTDLTDTEPCFPKKRHVARAGQNGGLAAKYTEAAKLCFEVHLAAVGIHKQQDPP